MEESAFTWSSFKAPRRRRISMAATGRARSGLDWSPSAILIGDAVRRAAFAAGTGQKRQRLVALRAALGEDLPRANGHQRGVKPGRSGDHVRVSWSWRQRSCAARIASVRAGWRDQPAAQKRARLCPSGWQTRALNNRPFRAVISVNRHPGHL